ncbi:MAG: hypothetical protein KBT76_14705 [Sulfitobacter litoralis]|nr:hypothetical protein [Sulfitobacter litoralis]
MSNVNYAELTLGANTAGLLKAKTDLAAVTKAGAATESSVTKSMQSTEKAISQLPNATAAATRGFTDLRTSLDPLYAASKQYEAAQGQVAAAVRAGAASQAEANSVLALAEKRYLGVSTAAKTTNSALKAASTGMNSFAFQSRMAAMQLSQVAQQTMAGGGFIRALSIQLPDLALGFGAVGIAAGVAAGVLLPMAANFITGADNADELEDALDSLAQTSREYIEINKMTKQSVSELAFEFGGFSAEIQRTYEILQGVAFERTLDSLGVAIAALDVSRLEFLVGVFQQGQGEIEAFNQNYNDALAEIKESFGLTGSQAEEFLGQLNALKTADGPDEIVRAADRLNAFLIESYGSARKIPPELRDMVQRLGEAQTVAARVAANVDGSADSANAAATAAANLSGQLSVAAQYAGQLAANLAMAPAGIQGFQDKAAQLTAQISALDAGYSQITASAAGYRKELEQKYGLADAANAAEEAYISGVINRQVKEYTNVQELNKAYTDKVTALNKVGTAGAAAGASTAKGLKAASSLANEIDRLEFDADPLKKYNAELANLDKLLAGDGASKLSDGAYRKAVEELNDEFANSDPMISKAGDAISYFVAGGMRDFKSLLGAFKDMLSQMIATAISNPIKLALMGGSVGGGLAGTAAQAAGSAPGGGIFGSLGSGGGLLGSIGGTVGALTSGIGAGFNMALGGLTSGGLSGLGSVLSTQLGAATATVGSFGAALGAIALPLAGVAAVFSFFSKSVRELDSGLRITTDGMDSLIESFTKTETKRFWGLSKKVRTSYSALDAEQAEPLERVISELQWGVLDAAEILGIGTTAFEDFTSSIKISTKGLSETDAQKAIEEALTGFGDDFAGMVPGLEELHLAGEGAYAALERLSSRVVGVNASFDMLGFSLYELSLSGADAASSFVDLFGTLDDFNSITGSYYENFYSDAERIAKATQLVTDSLLDLGIDGLPATRRAFRELVEETEALGDDDLLASLLKLSPAFAEITAATDALAASANALITEDAFATGFDYARSLAQAQNNIAYQPPAVSNAFGSVPRAQQDMTAELRGIRADLTLLQSTMQITAANTGRAADAADDTLAVTLENAL